MIEEKIHSELFRSISRELLARGHGVRFKAVGASMGSTIRDGEIVYVEPLPAQLRRGDIVLYADDDRLRMHRVVSVNRSCRTLLTRGDALMAPDPPIAAEQVLGRVVAKDEAADGTGRVVSLRGLHPVVMFWAMLLRFWISRLTKRFSVLKARK